MMNGTKKARPGVAAPERTVRRREKRASKLVHLYHITDGRLLSIETWA